MNNIINNKHIEKNINESTRSCPPHTHTHTHVHNIHWTLERGESLGNAMLCYVTLMVGWVTEEQHVSTTEPPPRPDQQTVKQKHKLLLAPENQECQPCHDPLLSTPHSSLQSHSPHIRIGIDPWRTCKTEAAQSFRFDLWLAPSSWLWLHSTIVHSEKKVVSTKITNWIIHRRYLCTRHQLQQPTATWQHPLFPCHTQASTPSNHSA